MGKVRVAIDVDGELERSLRQFKSKLKKERVLEDLKRKRYFEKPSDIRRREKLKARKRHVRKITKGRRP